MSRFISMVKNKQGQKTKDAKAQEKTTRCGYKLEKKKIQTARFLQSVLVKFLHQFKTLLTVRNPETQTTKQRSCPSILHCQLIPYITLLTRGETFVLHVYTLESTEAIQVMNIGVRINTYIY